MIPGEQPPSLPIPGLPIDDRCYRLLIEAISSYAICMLDPEGVVMSWSPGGERCECRPKYPARAAYRHAALVPRRCWLASELMAAGCRRVAGRSSPQTSLDAIFSWRWFPGPRFRGGDEDRYEPTTPSRRNPSTSASLMSNQEVSTSAVC